MTMPRVGDVMLATAVVAAMAVMPSVYSNELLLFNFVMFLTLSQGLNIIYGFTGYLPFGYVGFFGAGAYGFAIAVMNYGAGPLPAMAVGAAAAVVLGLVLIPLLRLSGAYFAIANLAAAQAVYQVVSNPALESVTKGPYGVSLMLMQTYLSSWANLLPNLLLIAVLLIRPEGLLGRKVRRA